MLTVKNWKHRLCVVVKHFYTELLMEHLLEKMENVRVGNRQR